MNKHLFFEGPNVRIPFRIPLQGFRVSSGIYTETQTLKPKLHQNPTRTKPNKCPTSQAATVLHCFTIQVQSPRLKLKNRFLNGPRGVGPARAKLMIGISMTRKWFLYGLTLKRDPLKGYYKG